MCSFVPTTNDIFQKLWLQNLAVFVLKAYRDVIILVISEVCGLSIVCNACY